MLITFSVHCIHIWRICIYWNIDESIFLKTNEYFRSSGWLAVWTWPVGRALSAPSLCTGQRLHHGRWGLWQRSWWLCWWCIIIVLPYYKEMTGKGRGANLCKPQSNTGWQQSDQVDNPSFQLKDHKIKLELSRGGVPVCFPAFGPWPLGAQHGFARTSTWCQDGEISTDQVCNHLNFGGCNILET